MSVGGVTGAGGLSTPSITNNTSTNLFNNPSLLQANIPGISVNSLVTAFEAQQHLLEAPLQQLANQQTEFSNESQAYSTVSSALSTVQTDIQALSTAADLNPTGAPTSSNPNVATATGAGAPTGNYVVSVTQLAQPQIVNSNTVSAAASTALGESGTITLTYNNGVTSDSVPVTVSAKDSLATIAQNIENASANIPGLNLSAVVLPSGSDSVLSLSADTGGSGLSLATSLTGSNALSFTGQTGSQSGQSAQYTLNGVANTANTNLIQGALGTGVNLTLTGTGGSTTLSVASDPGTVSTAVGQLVTDLQTALTTIQSQTGKGGTLEGQVSVQNAGQTLVGFLTQPQTSSGLPAGYQSLASLGVNVSWSQQNGLQVAFNAQTFEQALQSNPSAVTQLFTGTNGVATQMNKYLTNLLTPITGIIPSAQQSLTTQEQQMVTNATNMQSLIQQEVQQAQSQFLSNLQSMLKSATVSQTLSADFSAMSGGSSGSSSGSKSGG